MRCCALVLAASVLVVAPASATLVTIDFDSLPAVSNNTQAGNTFAADGVHFTTLNTIPDTVSVGDILSPTVFSDTFWLISNGNSVSPPNFAAATNGGFFDLLMTFDGPVSTISLQTDDTDENADLVRLLGLQVVGPNQYQIVALAEGLDNAVSAPGNILFISVPITHAIFQTTTEQEGFDNLVFDLTRQAPEPSTLALMGAGLAALSLKSRGHRRKSR